MTMDPDALSIPDELDPDRERVNPHYLNHMVETAASREVQASEDIVSGSGIKLLAKGARISAQARERLLQHKLAKPLEDCVQVVNGVMPQSLAPLAERLLEQQPLLAQLCEHPRALPVPQSLAGLSLSVPVQSLLTLYADYQGDRLSHSVGVAMLSLALARRLLPGDIERHRQLALAGLLHDVGELYIDPEHLRTDRPLQPEQWRHIASHPVIGWRVLREMKGAGKQVAEAVLTHHERLDGFGYPRGIADEEFPLQGQILATSEWLMALIETGIAPLARASVASKLMPGEFGKPLQQVLSQLGGVDTDMADWLQAQQPLSEMLPEIRRVMATLRRFRALRAEIDQQIEQAGPRLRKVLQQSLNRMLRIQAAFSSSGLDADADPERMLAELAAQGDPKVQQEVQALAREFSWRMRELQRESLLRAGLLGDADAAVMQGLTDRLRWDGPAT
ncbi:HD domain-containing protein [Paucibacter sp. O1-1]|nr:HD domain-containing protein [Paucibacter sp. O1-1]MDA3825847.1 HD domain-containing protein [Paucibacter sp. O1-1]